MFRLEADPLRAEPGAPRGTRPRRFLRYGVACVAVAVALALNGAFWPLIEPAVSPLFFAGVMVAAWYGGLGPGLVATVLATAASAYFFMPPLYSLQVGYDDVLRLLVFAMVAVLISTLNAQRERAERGRDELLAREQDARREAEAANRAKDDFLAMVSHELRTPLTAILGWAGVLRAGTLPPARAARALEVIERNTEAQLQLIEDLLDVSRIVSGKLALTKRPMNLGQVVEHAVATVTPTAASSGIRLTTCVPEDTIAVDGDPDRLRQVVLNLLANAIKFTPRSGSVDVTLERTGAAAHLAVRDTGRGIRREFLPHVFERFRQADGAAALGGLGLGLAIARHIIEQHDGSISADSAGEGRGTVFTVTLPITAKPLRILPLTTGDGVGPVAEDVTALRHLHVLVVDDDAETRDFLVSLLRHYGADAVAVGSAVDALGAISRRRPDVLVSDIGMPGENGYALLRRLRALPPEIGGTVPALALSAYSGVDDADRALSAGFQLHLGKPVQPTTLVAAVAMLAGRRPGADVVRSQLDVSRFGPDPAGRAGSV